MSCFLRRAAYRPLRAAVGEGFVATPVAEIARYSQFGFPGGARYGVAEVPAHIFWDPRWYCQWLTVRPKEGGITPFRLQSQQYLMAEAYLEAMYRGMWLAEVKPRQLGSSTFFTAVVAWQVMWNRGFRACIMGFKDKNALELAKHVVRYFDDLDPNIKRFLPPKNKRSVRTLDLPTVSSRVATNSVLEDEPGRGDTNQFALATELSSWEGNKAPGAWKAFRSSVPSTGMLVAESTPRFVDDPLHLVWQESYQPESRWLRLFIPWFVVPEYWAAPPPGWTPSGIVRDYADKYYDRGQLTVGHLYWMERFGLPAVAATKGGSATLDAFMSEYPYDELECWIAAGEAIFDRAALIARYDELTDGGRKRQSPGVEEWYAEVKTGHRYVLAIDPASSFVERDQFGFVLMDVYDFEQVYDRVEHTDAHKAGQVVKALVDKVEMAGAEIKIVVERNGVGEALLLHLVNDLGLGDRVISSRPGRDMTSRPVKGWCSSSFNKTDAVVTAQQWIADGSVTLQSVRLLSQLRAYRDQWSKARDKDGGHYDLVAAFCMCCWYIKYNGRQPVRVSAPRQYDGVGTVNKGVLEKLLNHEPSGRKTHFGNTM